MESLLNSQTPQTSSAGSWFGTLLNTTKAAYDAYANTKKTSAPAASAGSPAPTSGGMSTNVMLLIGAAVVGVVLLVTLRK